MKYPLIGLLFLMLTGANMLHAQENQRHSRFRPPHHKPKVVKPPVIDPYKPRGYANVVTFVPSLILIGSDELCMSGGFEYERFFNKKGHFSIATTAHGFITSAMDVDVIKGFEIRPAFLYHPKGNTKQIDYSAGIAIGAGYIYTEANNWHTVSPRGNSDNNFGTVLGQINFKVHRNTKVVWGFHLAAGALFESGKKATSLVQVGFKIGARF